MALPARESLHELEGVLHEAAGRLSPTQVAVLVAHPDAVRSALAVAADMLAAGDAKQPGIETIGGFRPVRAGAEVARRQMVEPTCMGEPERLLTSDELAARVGLKSRQSVHDWLRKGRIVGWRGAKRGYLFPERQFDERNRPFKGFDRVIGLFGDSHAAWSWLTTPRPSLDGAMPLELLARGEIDSVEKAAVGDLQGDFA